MDVKWQPCNCYSKQEGQKRSLSNDMAAATVLSSMSTHCEGLDQIGCLNLLGRAGPELTCGTLEVVENMNWMEHCPPLLLLIPVSCLP